MSMYLVGYYHMIHASWHHIWWASCNTDIATNTEIDTLPLLYAIYNISRLHHTAWYTINNTSNKHFMIETVLPYHCYIMALNTCAKLVYVLECHIRRLMECIGTTWIILCQTSSWTWASRTIGWHCPFDRHESWLVIILIIPRVLISTTGFQRLQGFSCQFIISQSVLKSPMVAFQLQYLIFS
jgi:hypothetical protein